MAWFRPDSRWRQVLDGAWLVGFAVCVGLLLVGASDKEGLQAAASLELLEGVQRRAVYRGGIKLGVVRDGTKKRKQGGWVVTQEFLLPSTSENKASQAIGKATLLLREDLSIERIRVRADVSKLKKRVRFADVLLSALGGKDVSLDGECQPITGRCSIKGYLGKRHFSQSVTAGRGPVIPRAVYPLLTRGLLGNKADLNIFDPISLRRSSVSYRVRGREQLTLRSGTFDAVLVSQDALGVYTKLWLDRRGWILKEQLPFGVSIEHEAFE